MVYLACHVIVDGRAQSSIDSLSDSLRIRKQPLNGGRPGPGLNSIGSVPTELDCVAVNTQSRASKLTRCVMEPK